MDLRELIVLGNGKAGSQTDLAKLLDIHPVALAEAKAGKRGLPNNACFTLAKLIEINPATVIAASSLVTEKNEEKRKVFYPFVMGKAASIAAIAVLLGTTALPSDSHAMSGNSQHGKNAIYIM